MYYHVEQLYYEREKELIAQEGFFSDIKNRIKDLIDKFIKWWKNWFAEIRKKLERLKIRFGHRKFQKEHPEYKFSKEGKFGMVIGRDYDFTNKFLDKLYNVRFRFEKILFNLRMVYNKNSLINQWKDIKRSDELIGFSTLLPDIRHISKEADTLVQVYKRYRNYSMDFEIDNNNYIDSLKSIIDSTSDIIQNIDEFCNRIFDIYNGRHDDDGDEYIDSKENERELEEFIVFFTSLCNEFSTFYNKIVSIYEKIKETKTDVDINDVSQTS